VIAATKYGLMIEIKEIYREHFINSRELSILEKQISFREFCAATNIFISYSNGHAKIVHINIWGFSIAFTQTGL
jgi:hypothetical protein